MKTKPQFPPSLLCCLMWTLLLTTSLATGLRAETTSDPRVPESLSIQPSAAPSPLGAAAGGQADILDIYGPIELPVPTPYGRYALFALLAAGAIGSLTLFILHRNKKRQSRRDVEDPADRALAELHRAALLNDNSGEPGAIASTGSVTYCENVSRILRDYVEAISSRRLVSQTSTECLEKLARPQYQIPGLGNEQIDILKQCFKCCDMAKFAHAAPESRETAALGKMAEAFITATRTTRGED
jgi:hypothetical protein